MAIAFRSATSIAYGSGHTNTVLTAPAGLANGDILVAVVLTAITGTPPTPTPPAGFTSYGTATAVDDGSLFAKLHIFWKRAASESGSYTFTHSTCSSQGVLKAYSGCLASGTPLGATANSTGVSPTLNVSVGTSITTTAANSYLLFEAHDWTGNGALSPPTGMTERFDNLIYSADQLIASAGATGTRTQTNGNPASGVAGAWAVRMVELLVASGSGSTFNDTTAETATAAETPTGRIVTTKAIAETAAAADTVTGLAVRAGAVAEVASAVETTNAAVVSAGIYNVSVAETAVIAETLTGRLVIVAATAESASAAETLAGTIVPPQVIVETIAESVSAIDIVSCVHIRPWRTEAPLHQAWTLQLLGLRERVTEASDRRITEDGATRIIESVGRPWTKETVTGNFWTRETV